VSVPRWAHDVRSVEDMHSLAEGARQDMQDTAETLANIADALERRIVAQLRKEGIDHSGRLAAILGTSAERAAKDCTRHIRNAAAYLSSSAAAMTEAKRKFDGIAESIRAAREAREDADALKI
jgi:hypothetical protein